MSPSTQSYKPPQYFEAILQLREVTPEIIQFAEREITKTKLTLAKKVELESGYDYYLSDHRLTQTLGRKLFLTFGGEFKITSSLWGRKKDKDIYRLTVLFRGIPFKKGEMVEYRGDKYEIKSLGKDILLQRAITGEKMHLKYSEQRNLRKV